MLGYLFFYLGSMDQRDKRLDQLTWALELEDLSMTQRIQWLWLNKKTEGQIMPFYVAMGQKLVTKVLKSLQFLLKNSDIP